MTKNNEPVAVINNVSLTESQLRDGLRQIEEAKQKQANTIYTTCGGDAWIIPIGVLRKMVSVADCGSKTHVYIDKYTQLIGFPGIDGFVDLSIWSDVPR